MLAYKYPNADAQRYRDHSQHIHQQTLSRIKDRSPSTSPANKSPATRPKLVSYQESERQDEINRENRILMTKLLSISESKALRRTLRSVEPRSLNLNRRKREEERIRAENAALGRRLLEKVSSASRKRLELECYSGMRERRKPPISLPPLQEGSQSQGQISCPLTAKASEKTDEVTGITLDQYLSGRPLAQTLPSKKPNRGRTKAPAASALSGFPTVLETVAEYAKGGRRQLEAARLLVQRQVSAAGVGIDAGLTTAAARLDTLYSALLQCVQVDFQELVRVMVRVMVLTPQRKLWEEALERTLSDLWERRQGGSVCAVMSRCAMEDVVGEVTQRFVKGVCEREVKSFAGKIADEALAPLEAWAKSRLLPWLAQLDLASVDVFPELWHQLGVLRVSQMFDIVLEYPASKPALNDLATCLRRVPALVPVLECRLIEQMSTRAVQPSKPTEGILLLYINLSKTMKHLFTTIEVLEAAAEPLKTALRKRTDTFRCIIQSISEDVELYQMLDIKQKNVKEMDEFSSEEDEAAAGEWQPIPRSAVRSVISALNKRSDLVSMLVNIYGSPEQFMDDYRTFLAQKLVAASDFQATAELKDLEMLKKRFGEANVHKCEVMLQDVANSKRINSFIHEASQSPLHTLIISSYFWPIEESEAHFKLPPQLQIAFDWYSQRYTVAKASRKLKFHETMGKVTVTLEFENGSKTWTDVTPLHAAIVSLFNDDSGKKSADELASSLSISVGLLRKEIAIWESRGAIGMDSENSLWRARYFRLLKEELQGLRTVGTFRAQAPVYTVTFAQGETATLMASDESGFVYLLDTSDDSVYAKDQFRAHNNSILDSQWTQDGLHVMTASGDLTAAVWDVETKKAAVLGGHCGSVKCIRNSPIWREVYVTVARDERILIWDLRDSRGAQVAPIGYISEELVKPTLGNRGKRSPQSYTCVELLCDGNVAVTCDAHEVAVKFWDLRKMVGTNPSKNRAKATPKFIGSVDPVTARRVQYAQWLEQLKLSTHFLAPLTSRDTSPSRRFEEVVQTRACGSASMALAQSRNQMLVATLSNSVVVYPSISKVDVVPPTVLSGAKISFYTKSQFSVDERFVVSGSQDRSLRIWDLECPTWQVVIPEAHSQEVNCVSWADSNSRFIATGSDDHDVKIWDIPS